MKLLKKIFSSFILATISLCLVSCLGGEPKISVTANISDISDDTFATMATSEISKPSKEDFKQLSFKLNIKNPSGMKEKSISLPNFKEDIKSFSDTIYCDEDSNSTEGSSGYVYTDDIILFTRGINTDNLKNIFSKSKLTITWTDKDGNDKSEEFIISDILTFE